MKSNNKTVVNGSKNVSYDEILEYIEFDNLSDEELKKINGLDLLTSKSKNAFISRCNKIQVPNKIDHYNSLIIEHQSEIAYRKARDEEHIFRDVSIFIRTGSKIAFRNDKAVIAIDASDNQIKRAYRIIDTFLKVVKDFNGNFIVPYGEGDNLYINLFGDRFSFVLTENKVKNRRVLSESPKENSMKKFRPTYESIYSGELEIELKEVTSYRDDNNTPSMIKLTDKVNNPIENCLGEVFISLAEMANELRISNTILWRENKRNLEEEEHLNKIEEENKRAIQEIKRIKHCKQNLLENIEPQMESWFKSQKLIKYAEELELVAREMIDETEKELLIQYIMQVRQKADRLESIKDILNDLKVIGMDGFKE